MVYVKRMLMFRRALLLLAAVCALGGVFLSYTGNPAAAEPSAQSAAGLAHAIEENFVIFRERPASRMPAEVAASVASPERFGRNAAQAREFRTAHGSGWIIPGDGWLCIVVPDPVDWYGTSCNTVESALIRGVTVAIRDSKTYEGYETTLIPDGSTAKLSSGSLPLRDDAGIVSVEVGGDQEVAVTRD
jgi:hypothetical protein